MTEQLEKFEHSGQTAEGCGTGLHLYEEDPNSPNAPTIMSDGVLTKLVMHCKRCGAQHEVSAPLGMNDLISRTQDGQAPATPQRREYPQMQQQQPQQISMGPSENDVLKKLFG